MVPGRGLASLRATACPAEPTSVSRCASPGVSRLAPGACGPSLPAGTLPRPFPSRGLCPGFGGSRSEGRLKGECEGLRGHCPLASPKPGRRQLGPRSPSPAAGHTCYRALAAETQAVRAGGPSRCWVFLEGSWGLRGGDPAGEGVMGSPAVRRSGWPGPRAAAPAPPACFAPGSSIRSPPRGDRSSCLRPAALRALGLPGAASASSARLSIPARPSPAVWAQPRRPLLSRGAGSPGRGGGLRIPRAGRALPKAIPAPLSPGPGCSSDRRKSLSERRLEGGHPRISPLFSAGMEGGLEGKEPRGARASGRNEGAGRSSPPRARWMQSPQTRRRFLSCATPAHGHRGHR
nr:translation initiation factor IF-2-like [Saimiri boliviensis boliviensis]